MRDGPQSAIVGDPFIAMPQGVSGQILDLSDDLVLRGFRH